MKPKASKVISGIIESVSPAGLFVQAQEEAKAIIRELMVCSIRAVKERGAFLAEAIEDFASGHITQEEFEALIKGEVCVLRGIGRELAEAEKIALEGLVRRIGMVAITMVITAA
jgi:hypothetical protein